MKTEQAIKFFEKICTNGHNTEEDRTALEALREKHQRDNQQPLTLEELKERIGKPVYNIGLSNGYEFAPGWFIVANYWNFSDYGKSWLAYDHEPNEEGER